MQLIFLSPAHAIERVPGALSGQGNTVEGLIDVMVTAL